MFEGKINVRTDLALESAQLLMNNSGLSSIEGVEIKISNMGRGDNIKLTEVGIISETAAEQMGKPIGNYITIESDDLRDNEVLAHEEIIRLLSEKLASLCRLGKDSVILLVGLGNWNVTPDSLGPKVISKALVTRHVMDCLPDELQNKSRAVCAISPGVMGITGIETREIVKGVCDRVKPDLVIAVDALAARSAKRINTAIQLSDAGVNPGSGIGNARTGINAETLGAPVIGIGVPTVVDAATLVNDTMDLIIRTMADELPESSAFLGTLGALESEEKYSLIRGLLDPNAENMFVAPKEVDSVMERLSNIIANAINVALHPGIDQKDINRYIY